ncbi:MAG TPA: hypothetical protein VG711_03495 [Phycisphaerales bacterium]|nr:hypothetical protein [Phycisphaerales bacterium]
MNRVASIALGISLSASITYLAIPAKPAIAQATGGNSSSTAQQQTEDILYMADGRVLHGKIISETRSEIVFKYVDQQLNLSAQLTLQRADITDIKRDVPVEAPASATPDSTNTSPAATETSSAPVDATPKSYGTFRYKDHHEGVKTIYVIPMSGQLGTDVAFDTYDKLVPDIIAAKPDLIVIDFTSSDVSGDLNEALQIEHPEGMMERRQEYSLLDFEQYNKIVAIFRNRLRDIPQVVWVHDSVGLSTLVAMSWPKIYMTPKARFGGLSNVLLMSGAPMWQDPDIRAKMTAAWTGGAKGFLEVGGYSLALGDAMIDPAKKLSAVFQGRKVIWRLDTGGEIVVDDDDKMPANFSAKLAEDLLLSQGTAENIEDLMLLQGIREFQVIDEPAKKAVDNYISEWRRAFANCRTWLRDFNQYMGWATGADAVAYLGKAKGRLEDILAAMNHYEAVETRLKMVGVDKLSIEILIDKLKERIRALKDRGGSAAGAGGARGGRAGGSAGGGGGRGR